MTLFWMIAAAMLVVAVAVVVVPMLRRPRAAQAPSSDAVNLALYHSCLAELEADFQNETISPDQFEQAKHELQRGLLLDVAAPLSQPPAPVGRTGLGRWSSAVVIVILPLVAVGLYLHLGDQRAFSVSKSLPQSVQASDPHQGAGAEQGNANLPSVEEMTTALAARLSENPSDAKGWVMLARSYVALGRYGEANLAFSRAHELLGDQPDLLVQYAESLAMLNDNRMSGKPVELVQATLAIDPNHRTALWLAGVAAYQAKDYRGAVERWERLSRLLSSEEQKEGLRKYIAQAKAQIGAGGAAAPAAGDGATPGVAATGPRAARESGTSSPGAEASSGIVAKVSVNPELMERVRPDDVLFVFARAAEGPKMPLAIERHKARELPLEVRLDDSMAMMPAMRMSNFPQVMIGARISRSGNGEATSGDLEGFIGPIATGQGGVVQVSIDRIVR
jgi:cytochrome c-type biogenesis protein CcmH